MSKAREECARLLARIEAGGGVGIARRTEFVANGDGSFRRRISGPDGVVKREETIPAARIMALSARNKAGLSQSQFAALLGISVRTLHDWEQGRREPSGAARTLLKIAFLKPGVLREVLEEV